MKKTLKTYLLGFLTAAVLTGGVTYAANTTTLYNVVASGIKIVIDGERIIPTDANGNTVEPIIYNGTTYLPIRAVAKAFGKAVYWDGPTYTAYIGDMNGTLKYASKELTYEDSIGEFWSDASGNKLKDNYGNMYSRAIYSYPFYSSNQNSFEVLCNYQYSRLKGTIYIVNGYSGDESGQIIVKTDGKTIYTSSELDKTSSPIPIDINITGCNYLEIISTGKIGLKGDLCIGNLGLYQ